MASAILQLFEREVVRLISSVAVVSLLLFKGLAMLWGRRPAPPDGASVFITGAGTGIGRATALLLNSKGFNVFAGVISADEGVALKAEAVNRSLLTPLVVDVTNVEAVRKTAAAVSAATGGQLWGIVNNAGINYADGPVEFVPLDRVRRTFEVNVMGIYNVCQAFLPLVRASKGRVVNIASINGFFTWTDHTPYCVSKHGVEALTDGLRLEMEPFGVSVSVIEPGGVKTPIFEASVESVRVCQEQMGPEYRKVYPGKDLDSVRKNVMKMHAGNSDPIVVAKAIHHALSSTRPKLRYVVARGGWAMHILKRYLLTDRMFHQMMYTIMSLSQKRNRSKVTKTH